MQRSTFIIKIISRKKKVFFNQYYDAQKDTGNINLWVWLLDGSYSSWINVQDYLYIAWFIFTETTPTLWLMKQSLNQDLKNSLTVFWVVELWNNRAETNNYAICIYRIKTSNHLYVEKNQQLNYTRILNINIQFKKSSFTTNLYKMHICHTYFIYKRHMYTKLYVYKISPSFSLSHPQDPTQHYSSLN